MQPGAAIRTPRPSAAKQPPTPVRQPHPTVGRLFAYALAATIFAGSLFMWIGLPFACLWLVSHFDDDSATNFLFLLLLITPLAMIVFGLMLGRLNALYLRVSGAHPAQTHTAWLKSLSGEAAPRRPPAVLEISMTISVIVAIVLMLVFFFFFAESYLPAPIAP